MAARARSRGSGHGINGPILETSVGSAREVLEADTREARRRKPQVWNVAFGTGAIQSRAAGAEKGFPRCRTPGETASRNLSQLGKRGSCLLKWGVARSFRDVL